MLRCTPFLPVLLIAVLGLLPSVSAESGGVGAITGRVFNPATGEYIRNAVVRVEGTPLTTVSEEGGFYRLDHAPAGMLTVVATYTGLGSVSASLSLAAGDTATRDFELAPADFRRPPGDAAIRLTEFVVATEREGNAKAIMEQKNAINMKTVVATDSFGDIAEGNIGEFLKFMPGITLDYVETDTRAARMGGLEARYGAVTLDGGSMANTSTGGFGGDSRQFEFEAVSINNIETIEVNKTLTADMPADAPAGSINLRTRSALDRKGSRFSTLVGFIGNEYEHSLRRTPRHDDARHAKTRPTGSFDYSNSFFDNKVGIAVNGAFTNVFKEQFRHALTYDYTSAQAIAAKSPLITALNFKDGPKMTEKSSGGLKVDYQPFGSNNLRVTLATSYIYFADEIANRNLNFRVNAAQLGAGSSLTRVVAGPVAGTGTRIEQTGSHGKKKTDTTNLSLGFVYRLRALTVDAQSSYSRARQQNGTGHMGAVDQANLQLTRISYTAERPSVDSPAWTFTQTGGANWYDLSNYGRYDAQAGNISVSRSRAQTEQIVQQINARYVLPWQLPTFVKAGLYHQLMTRNREQIVAYTGTYVGPSGNQLTAPLPSSAASFLISTAWGGNIAGLPVPDKAALNDLLRTQPSYFTSTVAQQAANLDSLLGSPQDVEEAVRAGYLMVNTRIGLWQVYGGLRYEGTHTTTEVMERVPDAKNPFAANTLERIRYRWSQGSTIRDGRYDDFLPSASVVYRASPDLIAKFGYHRAIKRPALDRLAGTWSIDEANQDITIPNPDLKPERSQKFSALVEYYFEPAGTIGLNVFRTDIKNATNTSEYRPASDFGYGDDPIYGAYDFRTFENVPGTRKIQGIEFNYSQQMAFLRNEYLRGTRIFATYSRYRSKPQPNGFVPTAITGGISNRYKRFNASLAGTWTDDILTGGNGVSATAPYFAGDREYLKHRTIIDVGLGYKVHKYAELFLSGRNAFNSGKTWVYRDTDGRIRQMEKYGGQWTVGVKSNF
ncbi:MAG: TonB-dependent receptor [Opitutaceae bacterium]|nr:TonB-dependent receptor [Opitutaceae bacterium]